ncbi:MAG: four helix bundle protein [Alphaproteobacteria bacterium]|nr:four helix bundle protein [Alphaproteobacteria bacterium]
MTLATDLPIYKPTYDLILLVMNLTKNFPRSFRHGLARDIDLGAQQLATAIFQANCTTDKVPVIEGLRERLSVLRLQLRLSKDLHLISAGQFGATVELTAAIGKQATGWLNYAKKRRAPDA